MRLDQLRLLFDAGNLMAADIVVAPLKGSAHETEKSYSKPLEISYPSIQPHGLQGRWFAGLPAVLGARSLKVDRSQCPRLGGSEKEFLMDQINRERGRVIAIRIAQDWGLNNFEIQQLLATTWNISATFSGSTKSSEPSSHLKSKRMPGPLNSTAISVAGVPWRLCSMVT